ncbi:TolC family protein [Desulfocurvibacter africanus]|uniref:Outer membrane efflux protein n=1 Tax=Desulfocurvibacter africanus subsp. africanus str. Walvis Bay TaxID=690850 RepID=F3YVU0_DESAF|nr:TolC family protein [Desulfocurvibacter africanus]EGJ48898.1 outer membrane efflux protein [Desulfocurvibacter africanus subsp. africanus str. Walvis Bay]
MCLRVPSNLFALALLMVLAACASTDPAGNIQAVGADVAARTGYSAQRLDGTQAESHSQQAVQDMLADGLGENEAVRIALLNSKRVQALFEGLGVARAEYVQAGLVDNPVFAGAYRYTPGDGSTWELEIAQSLTGLLFTPLRRSVARAELARAESLATAQVLDIILESRRAWFAHQAALERTRAAQLMAETSRAALDLALRLRAAGNITELDLLTRQAMHEEDRILQADEELTLGRARERLNAALGLWGPLAGWEPVGGLPPLPDRRDDADLAAERLESRAVAANLELAATRQELDALARTVGLERYAPFQEVEVGASLEREPGEKWGVGPSLALPIPLFDFGQARRARARARLSVVSREYEAQAVEMRAAARSAALTLEAARNRAEHYRSVLLPLRRDITAEGQLQNNAMNLSTIGLLDLKRAELDTERSAAEALHEYWRARSALEQIISGRIPGDMAANGGMPAASTSGGGGGH